MDTLVAPRGARRHLTPRQRFFTGHYIRLAGKGDSPAQLGRVTAVETNELGRTIVEAHVVKLGNGERPLRVDIHRFDTGLAEINGRAVTPLRRGPALRWLNNLASNLNQQRAFCPEMDPQARLGLLSLSNLSDGEVKAPAPCLA